MCLVGRVSSRKQRHSVGVRYVGPPLSSDNIMSPNTGTVRQRPLPLSMHATRYFLSIHGDLLYSPTLRDRVCCFFFLHICVATAKYDRLGVGATALDKKYWRLAGAGWRQHHTIAVSAQQDGRGGTAHVLAHCGHGHKKKKAHHKQKQILYLVRVRGSNLTSSWELYTMMRGIARTNTRQRLYVGAKS